MVFTRILTRMKDRHKTNVLLVANWKSDVGYAWWLMENFWAEIAEFCKERDWRCHVCYPEVSSLS